MTEYIGVGLLWILTCFLCYAAGRKAADRKMFKLTDEIIRELRATSE